MAVEKQLLENGSTLIMLPGMQQTTSTGGEYNLLVKDVPKDEHGFMQGRFTVVIKWEPV